MQYLDKDKNGEISLKTFAFSSKFTKDKSLFRRKHGTGKEIPANSSDTLSIIVPYDLAKINKVDLVGCELGDQVDLKVYDTPAGAISTVPNYMLNQFGFLVELPNGHFEDFSEYEADLIKDMKIEITYYNNSDQPKYVGANFTLHEVK